MRDLIGHDSYLPMGYSSGEIISIRTVSGVAGVSDETAGV